jgi:hypothetical protein
VDVSSLKGIMVGNGNVHRLLIASSYIYVCRTHVTDD